MISTSIDQSKRLLEAGLDGEETADFYYDSKGVLNWRGEPVLFMIGTFQTPAWSLSALWKEVSKVGKFAFQETDKPEDIIEGLVNLYEEYQNRDK